MTCVPLVQYTSTCINLMPPTSTIVVKVVLEVDICCHLSYDCTDVAADHEQQSTSRASLWKRKKKNFASQPSASQQDWPIILHFPPTNCIYAHVAQTRGLKFKDECSPEACQKTTWLLALSYTMYRTARQIVCTRI